MSFDPTKPVQTRDGLAARIVATDMSGGREPILAVITLSNGSDRPVQYPESGKYVHDTLVPHDLDLINIDEFAKPGRDIVKTRDGRRAWILTRETPWQSTSPIVAIIEGSVKATYHRADGTWVTGIKEDPRDLIL